MKNLYTKTKGKVHPSPSLTTHSSSAASSEAVSVLKVLPAAILDDALSDSPRLPLDNALSDSPRLLTLEFAAPMAARSGVSIGCGLGVNLGRTRIDTMQVHHQGCRTLVTYIADLWHQNSHMQKSLYVPRVENKKSFMRMLKITNREDLIENSMNILEPSAIDSSGMERQDGYAFDRSGRRLGRGGGYYDCFLANYMELASRKGWRQPLLVALAYSIQIVDDPIPVTPTDIHVDAIASPAGVLQISSAAMERM
ncbi:5-formyltetrahydrofolate cyclo-ligase [Nymphaea thermarum]|nr:5-formyltetrahydrofolate cyclo-ligase [Nymphaea thermarum]